MPYLSKDDYTLRISLVNLDEILAEASNGSGLTPDNILANAESWAMALMRSYLVTKYNIINQFDIISPNVRDFQTMQVLIDLVLCTLHKTINPRDIPEHIQNSCNEAMVWLKDARDGVIVVGIPGQTQIDGDTIYDRSFIQSQQKFVSKPYQDLSTFDNKWPLIP